MSAGSRTDVGAYHRDDNAATNKHLGDLSGQFSLMDHRTASEVSDMVSSLELRVCVNILGIRSRS